MIGNYRVLAVIPARGGSKRLPQKNIRELLGAPLIVHSIRAALNCKCIDKVLVSTDSLDIAHVAKDAGADIDERSHHLSTDTASTIDVLKDLLVRHQNYQICLTLQPTSPLRTAFDIVKSLELFCGLEADAVVSVCRADYPPQWINTIGAKGEMNDFLREEDQNRRSQDFDQYYRLNGAIYCNSVERLMQSDSLLFRSNCYAYVMPRERSVDIDTMEDFVLAEYYIAKFAHEE